MKLSIKSIEAVKASDKRQEYPDHLIKGLRLIVQPSGIKSFQLRYKFAGKSKRLTLGRWDRGLSLAAARDKAREELIKLENGYDPLHEKQQVIAANIDRTTNSTIGAAMQRYEVEKLDKLRSGDNAKSFLREFKAEYSHLELANFSKDMFRKMLREIVKQGHSVKANRVYTHVRTFMNWAEAEDLIEYNHLSKVRKPVEEVILTLPISRYFEPDDEGDLATVHTSIVSAHQTLDEVDALCIRLTGISRGIKEGHI